MQMGGLSDFWDGAKPSNPDNYGLQAMGKASSQRPEPIDYEALIDKQADVNRTNVYNPYGSSRWNKNKTSLSNKFSPGVQRIFDQQIAMTGMPASGENFNQDIEQATFKRAMNMLEPGMQQQSRDFEQQMATRGLPSGGAAYDNEFANVQRAQNSARENAALAAVLAGNEAAMRGRAQNLSERGQQFGEMSSILGRVPGAQQTSLDVVGPANMAMNNNLAGQQQMQNQKSSNANAAATAWAASDPRVKENAVVVAEFMPGINIHEFNYIGETERQLGFMSNEVKKVFPDAVRTRPDGIEEVNYGRFFNVH
jgi:hypothetical protein